MHNKHREASDDFHWEFVKSDADVLLEHILSGHAVCPAVFKDYSKVRNRDNFKKAQLFLLDIDNSDDNKKKLKEGYFSFMDAQNDPFIQKNALMLFTTPSHTVDWNRFRIVFLSDKRIYDKAEYKELLTKLIHVYNSDPSTSSAATYFYGNTRAEFSLLYNELDHTKILKFSDNKQDQRDFEKEAKHQYNGNISRELAVSMLDAIGPEPGYDIWFQILSAIGNYFPFDEALDIIEKWSPDKNQGTEYKLNNRAEKVGIGTLIYHAVNYGFDKSKLPMSKKNKKEPTLETHDGWEYSDLGNSRRLIAKYGKNLLYNNTDGYWYRWNGIHWKKDEKHSVLEFAKKITDSLKTIDFSKQYAKDHLRHFNSSGNSARLSAMLQLAETHPGISMLTTDFDQDMYKLNLANGIFDLKSLELLPHGREHFQTKCMPVDYEPDSECPKWESFMKDITDNDSTLITFIQRALGLSLCGDGLEEVLFFCFGTGKNGKSIFFNVVQRLFGTYFLKAPTSMIIVKKNEGVPNDVAKLPGARLVATSELEKGKRLNEAIVKDLTGNDHISARFLHKEFFEFKPSHTLWMYGNHKPIIQGSDEGIWRRMCLIPFKVTIAKEKQRDPSELVEDLLTEKSGILNWMLDGWADYSSKGLQRPRIVTQESNKYRSDSDIIGLFFEDVCIEEPGAEVVTTDIYEMYEFWCKKNREHPIKNRTFYTTLEERGFEKIMLPKGRIRVFKHLKMQDDWCKELAVAKDNRVGQTNMYN